MIKKSLVCLLVFNAACMQVTDKQAEETSPAQTEAQSASTGDNNVEITGLEPHKYSVSFQVNATETVVMKKVAATELAIPLTKGKWTDAENIEGTEVTYVLGSYQDSNFVESRTLTAKIPVDLVVTKVEQVLNLKKDFGRIFFQKDLAFYTMGAKLSLKAKEIFFQNNKIETFPPSQKAAPSTNGRSGGEILLEAERIAGELNVVLQGEAGGDGANGSAQGPAANGAPGVDGKYTIISKGGGLDNFTLRCFAPPTNGGPGMHGAKGISGAPGNNGGGTGSLLVKANDVSNLKLSHLKIPGKPGYGGTGGPGQIGGNGGPAGGHTTNGPSDQPCKPAKAGENGATGPYGDRGSDGQPGTVQSVCFLINNQRMCE